MRAGNLHIAAIFYAILWYDALSMSIGGNMGKPEEPYIEIIVETYYESGGGLHGDIHVRPAAGQVFPQHLRVRFPRAIRKANPVPSRFLVLAKLSDMDGGNEFIHTNHAWGYRKL